MLSLIQAELKTQKIDFLKSTGRTKNRAERVDRFQMGASPLFPISRKAGGSGLNLTAANTAIYDDPWCNPAVEDQATERAHRIGQEKPAFVYRLRTLGTVEEKIQGLQAKKRGLVDRLFDAGGNAITNLDVDDIAALFVPIEGRRGYQESDLWPTPSSVPVAINTMDRNKRLEQVKMLLEISFRLARHQWELQVADTYLL